MLKLTSFLTLLLLCFLDFSLAYLNKKSSQLDPFFLDYEKLASLNRKFTPKNLNDLSIVLKKEIPQEKLGTKTILIKTENPEKVILENSTFSLNGKLGIIKNFDTQPERILMYQNCFGLIMEFYQIFYSKIIENYLVLLAIFVIFILYVLTFLTRYLLNILMQNFLDNMKTEALKELLIMK